MRRGAADQAGVGIHRAEAEPAAGEDGLVRLVHLPVALLCAGFVGVERVGVLHDELAPAHQPEARPDLVPELDRKSTRLNSSHSQISYAVFCLKKKKTDNP